VGQQTGHVSPITLTRNPLRTVTRQAVALSGDHNGAALLTSGPAVAPVFSCRDGEGCDISVRPV